MGCGASWRRGIGLNKGPFLGEARDWVRPPRARGRAAVSRTDSRRELAAAQVRRVGRHHARAARARALLAQADRHERGLGRDHELRARVHHSRSRTVRATAARQPQSPHASSNWRARVILAQRVAPEPCAQHHSDLLERRALFGQIDGETSARRMIGDGSSHAPTARSERGAASERTSSRTRRRAHGLLTRTMPPGSGGSPYLIILELHGRGPISGN